MRKVSLLFMLLLALCCSRAALAAVTFDANKYYYIIEHTTGRCVSASATQKQGSYGLLAVGEFGDKFTFTSTNDGKWTIKTKSDSYFGAGTGTDHWDTSTRETAWTIAETSTSGVYTLYQHDAPSNNNTTKAGYLNYQTHSSLPAEWKNSLYVDYTTSADGDDTHHTKFRIVEAFYGKPQFGGVVWTYNTETSQFYAEGKESTATPGREGTAPNWTGPLYKFDNVGTVTVNTSGTDSSDDGGVWAIGSTTNVTCNLGNWAGGVLIEDNATVNMSWGSFQIKGTEDADYATFWVDGTLNIPSRSNFDMSDGDAQRWYISENSQVTTNFTTVTKKQSSEASEREWHIQIVVTDEPEVDGVARVTTMLRKKVITWNADIFDRINSITVVRKNEDGTYRKYDGEILHDATGLTLRYKGLGYNVECNYTLTDENDATYRGTYVLRWTDETKAEPTLTGVNGYQVTKVQFSNSDINYTMTAGITFPFPVSSNNTDTPTGIQSNLGSSKWYRATDDTGDYIKADNQDATVIFDDEKDNYNWCIYPSLNNGVFSFKIKNKASDKYIPSITGSQNTVKNYLVGEENAGSFYYLTCTKEQNGFSINSQGQVFLSINSDGTNQSIYAWNKNDNADHTGSNLTFPSITADYTMPQARAAITTYKGLPKFVIPEGSLVVGPTEFAPPRDIYTAIDAAKAIDLPADDAAVKEFIRSTDGRNLRTFQAKKTLINKPLATTQLEMKAQYGTLIIPNPSSRPDGLKFYSCNGTEGNTATLSLVEHTEDLQKRVPYIVENTDAQTLYTIIGWDYSAETMDETFEAGWLTGVLADNVYVPSGSYILSKYNNVLGFYQVDGDNVKICPKNKCYLTVPSTQGSQTRPFYFTGEGEVTGIEGIFGNTEKPVIYNTAGQRLNSLQKGVNIVNGHKVLVK